MDFIWPTELDNADKLLTIVGSFWSDMYAGRELVASTLHAKAQAHASTMLDFFDLLASVSRFKLPVFHAENWTVLPLLESELNSNNTLAFDRTEFTFADGLDFDASAHSPEFSWTAPANLKSAKVILNQITDATVTLLAGTDFYLANGLLWFRRNPFDTAGVRIENVYTDGVVTDRVAYLWLYRGEYDWDTLYKQFGYVVGARLTSSPEAKRLVNAIYDGMTGGTAAKAIETVLSAVCDVPVVETTETVTHILTDERAQWVITATHAYPHALDATLTVEVGDTVYAGQFLSNAVQIHDFNRGSTPDEIQALVLGKGVLANGYFQELLFRNAPVPLEVQENVDGYTKISCEVAGWPGDVIKFWDDVHARGVAAGYTLAMALDRRAVRTTQPTSMHLPAEINMVEFLVANYFRGNTFAVTVRPEYFGPRAIGLHAARFLRKLIPPQTLCLFISTFAATESVSMVGEGTESDPGYTEDVDIFLGNTLEELLDPALYVTEDVKISLIRGECR